MKRILKSTNWLVLFSGICTLIFGVSLLFLPLYSMGIIALLLGALIIVSGISQFVHGLRLPSGPRSSLMMAEGVVGVLIGAWMIFGNGVRVCWDVFPFIFAALVMVNGTIRADSAYSYRERGNNKWKWLFGVGASEFILGFILMFSPLVSAWVGTLILSLMIVLYGASNIALAFNAGEVSSFFRKMIRRMNAAGSAA